MRFNYKWLLIIILCHFVLYFYNINRQIYNFKITNDNFLNRRTKLNLVELMSVCDEKYSKIDDCLNSLVNSMYSNDSNLDITYKDDEKMLIHVYWFGEPTEKFSLMVKSFVYTQDLSSSQLHIWMDSNEQFDITKNKNISLFIPYVEKEYIVFHKLDIYQMLSSNADNVVIENILKKKMIKKKEIVKFSDLTRFIILYNYGGIYIDADTIFLRDMRDIYNIKNEWAYKWRHFNFMNTAILKLYKGSKIGEHIINEASNNDWNFHPKNISKYLNQKNYIYNNNEEVIPKDKFLILPTILFDPLWDKEIEYMPGLKKFSDVFTMSDNTEGKIFKDFFEGTYSYHWHNNWDTPISKNSWMDIINTEYNNFIENKKQNIYGEWNQI